MMWWNIIKAQQRSKEMINLDWEEEAVPMQEEEDCKKKLLSVYEYISSFTDIRFNESELYDNSFMKYIYNSDPDDYYKFQLYASIKDIDKFSNKEVCNFNEHLKEICQGIIDKRNVTKRIPYVGGSTPAKVIHGEDGIEFISRLVIITRKEKDVFALEIGLEYHPEKEDDTLSDKIVSLVTKIKGML